MKGCKIIGCDGKHLGMGLCSKHYQRARNADQLDEFGERALTKLADPLFVAFCRIRPPHRFLDGERQ